MPENNVNEPITDQEIAFACLVLTGTMTDRRAAEAVSLNPDTAAHTKAKPCVSAYILEQRAAMQQQSVQQNTEEHRFNQSRDRVLARLWQIADLPPEMTRNGMSAQVKALSMIIAIEGLIPNRRAVSAPNKPSAEPEVPPFYVSEWMRTQQSGQSAAPQPPTADQEPAPEPQPVPSSTPTPIEELSFRPELRRSAVEGPAVSAFLDAIQTTSLLPRVPMADYCAPDTRRPFSIDKNRFGRRR
jgi:hypothetical protein